jgi:hypothetical protein
MIKMASIRSYGVHMARPTHLVSFFQYQCSEVFYYEELGCLKSAKPMLRNHVRTSTQVGMQAGGEEASDEGLVWK